MCVQRHDAGLGVDQDLGDLHAADLAAGDVLVARLRSRWPGSTRPCPWPRPCRAGRRPPSRPTPSCSSCRRPCPARSPGPSGRPRPSARPSRTGRRAPPGAASSVAGACDGQVVLPPEPVERPNWLSPSLTVMSVGSRPRISATTMAVTVRWAVPRSCVEVSAVTEPSRLMVTVHSFGVPPAASRPRCAAPCRCRA